MNWVSELGKFIQQTEKTWLGLCVASAILWLFPELTVVGDLSDKSNSYFGASVRGTFILSASMLISSICFYVRDRVRDRNAERAKLDILNRLTPPERDLLRRYLKAQTKSMGQDPKDPIVVLLATRGWLQQPSTFLCVNEPFLPPYVLSDWVYDHVKSHPELIA